MSRLYVLPAGGGHVAQVRPSRPSAADVARHPSRYGIPAPDAPSIYDYSAEPETVFVPLTPLEWSLIHQALAERGQGNSLRPGSQPHADLAGKVREMVRRRVMRPTGDDPAHGYPRPAGASGELGSFVTRTS